VSGHAGIADVATSIGLAAAEQLVIVSGAGISSEHPTHAPRGEELMRQAMAGYFLPSTLDEVRAAYDGIRRVTGESEKRFEGRPRLEAVLDIASRTHGPAALAHLTTNFTGRPSNRVHRMLAAHLAAGGRQVTANFDRFIEHVAPSGTTGPHHFHGEVEAPLDVLPFGARLGAIEHGFDERDRELMLEALVDPRTVAIAWVGYSFSDYFDATPAVVGAIEAGGLDGKTILWFDHSSADPSVSGLPSAELLPAVIDAAVSRGLAIVRVVGRTGDGLFELLAALGCALDPGWSRAAACGGADGPVPSPYPADDAGRKAATLALLRRFGLLGRLPSAALGLAVEDIPADDLAEYWWKRGRYALGRASALAAIGSSDAHRTVRCLLVHARFDWIEGRYLRAGREVLVAVRALDADPLAPRELVVEALERFGRIARDMRRMPDAALLALPRLRRRLPDYEARAEAALADGRGVDGVALADLRDALQNYRDFVVDPAAPGSGASARARLIERFGQSESLDSYIDYVRGNANIGTWPFPRSGDDWQTPMGLLYDVVGNAADRRRLTLFQPSDGPLRELRPLRAARALDASDWHRFRMLGRFCLIRLRSAMRRLRSRWRGAGAAAPDPA